MERPCAEHLHGTVRAPAGQEIGELRIALVREIHETRSETITWTFLFWATQLTAFVGLLVFIFRNGAR